MSHLALANCIGASLATPKRVPRPRPMCTDHAIVASSLSRRLVRMPCDHDGGRWIRLVMVRNPECERVMGQMARKPSILAAYENTDYAAPIEYSLNEILTLLGVSFDVVSYGAMRQGVGASNALLTYGKTVPGSSTGCPHVHVFEGFTRGLDSPQCFVNGDAPRVVKR